jgi:hypothetical protein
MLWMSLSGSTLNSNTMLHTLQRNLVHCIILAFLKKSRCTMCSYSVAVITSDSESDNPGSSPGTSVFRRHDEKTNFITSSLSFMARWPSGLRRETQVLFFSEGVGSNPTLVTFPPVFPFFVTNQYHGHSFSWRKWKYVELTAKCT